MSFIFYKLRREALMLPSLNFKSVVKLAGRKGATNSMKPPHFYHYSTCDYRSQTTNTVNHGKNHDDLEYCPVCGHSFSSTYPLSFLSGRRNICVGCARFLGCFHGKPEAELNTKAVLLHSVNSSYTSHYKTLFARIEGINYLFFKSGDCYIYAKKKIKLMKRRRQGPIPVMVDELVQRMKDFHKSDVKLGFFGVYESKNTSMMDPLIMTVDHIKPVSKGGSWGSQNLQLIPHFMNQIKGNCDQDELLRWIMAYQLSSLKS